MSSAVTSSEIIPTRPVLSTTRILLAEEYPSGGRLDYVERIEDRVRNLENEIELLKQRQNRISPPNRIPVEILAEIFQIHTEVVREQYIYRSKNHQRTTWLWFTHVCKHWRTVALDCTAVWASPMFNAMPELTQTMLDRSKNAKLTVHFETNDPSHNAILVNTLSNPDRLRTLTVKCNDRNKFDISPSLAKLATTSVSLQTLHLEGTRKPRVKLPREFTLGDSPVLTHLNLTNINFEWDNIPLGPALQTLVLIPLHRWANVIPAWGKIRRALSLVPNLSYLRVALLFPDEKLPENIASNPINLPKLATIYVQDNTLALGEFFRMIKALASDAYVSVTFLDKGEAAVIERCIANLQNLPKNNRLQLKNLGVHEIRITTLLDGDGELEVEFKKREGSESGNCDSINIRFALVYIDDAMLRAFFTALKIHLGLRALSSLSIESSWLPRHILIEAFADLPALTHIETLGYFEDIIALLRNDPAQGAEEDPKEGEAYFPALRVLRFYEADLEDEYPDVNEFIAALRSRPPSRQVKELDFEQCSEHFPTSYPKDLRAAFPDIKISWDGEEDTDAEVSEDMEVDEDEDSDEDEGEGEDEDGVEDSSDEPEHSSGLSDS